MRLIAKPITHPAAEAPHGAHCETAAEPSARPVQGRHKPRRASLISCVAALALALAAASPSSAQSHPLHELARDLPAVETPPELTALQKQKLGRAIKKLRNSNASVRAKVEDDVIAVGRGALPALADAASTDHAGKMAGLQRCLVELVDLRDRLWVAEAMSSEDLVMRRFAAEATGKLGTPTLLKQVAQLLDDEDTVSATLAALSLTRAGDESALGTLVDLYVAADLAKTRASKSGRSKSSRGSPTAEVDWTPAILEALPQLYDVGSHEALLERLVVDDMLERDDPQASSAVRLAAVAMLDTIGDEAAVKGLIRALNDPHNIVQQESINALRRLVEDKPPFQGATFQQIRELERLKKLLKRWRGFDEK